MGCHDRVVWKTRLNGWEFSGIFGKKKPTKSVGLDEQLGLDEQCKDILRFCFLESIVWVVVSGSLLIF